MSGASPLLDSLAEAYEAAPPAGGRLAGPRRAALRGALAVGLPGRRSEAWKYTSLRALGQRRFTTAGAAQATGPAALEDIALPDAPRIVFVNGRFDIERSRLDGLAPGVSVQSLAAALADGEHAALEAMQGGFARADEVFAQLNAAFADEGVLVRVEAGTRLDQPIHVVFAGCAADGDRAWHLRHRFVVEPGAALRLVEHHVHAGDHAHLANQLTRIELARDAGLVHVRIQADANRATSLLRTDAVLAAGSRYRRLDLELGGGLSRHELNVQLNGEDAHLAANGVLLADGRRHLDTRITVEHVATGGHSHMNWHGIASGRGRAAFHGGIRIQAGADGSRAALSNRNLLLSEGAEIDTRPVLEIHADEVEAAHGATVGALDPDAMFYLRSRGLPAAEARRILTAAFCAAPLALIDDAGLRATLQARLDHHLEASALV